MPKSTATSDKAVSFGLVVFALSLAQFIMTVDTTIMNIAIPTVVEDLNTTVGEVQSAITLYALTMAAFMLFGAKLGEIHGRKKIFNIGLIIYAVGSLTTAFAPNLLTLIIGWSLLEGFGASLMMPAMMALISINFSGKRRVSALGIVAGVAGAAAALGPLIGGALSTYATWRYAFIGEVVIAIITLYLSKNILDSKTRNTDPLDLKGVVLAASGLGVFVFGILQASTYGWVRAIRPFEIGGFSFEPFGLSIVPFICGAGVFLIQRFLSYERYLEKQNKPTLLKASLLKKLTLRSSLNIVLLTQLVTGGILFILPLFLQLVLGFSAIESGIALLPLSIALIVSSSFSTRISELFGDTRTIKYGQYAIIFGIIILSTSISNETVATDMIFPMLFIGSGIGVIIPINQAILLSGVDKTDSSQVSGLNYTYQQLGMSLGTAVIGSVLLFSLGNGIVRGLSSSVIFDQAEVEANSTKISSNVQFVSNEQLEEILKTTDTNEKEQQEFIEINSDARLRALRASLVATALFVLLGIHSTTRLRDAKKGLSKA